jgi:hypothetical protein
MYLLLALAEAGSATSPIDWNIALGVGSLALVAGGIAAVVRRSLRPGQAFGVLGIAVAMAGLTAATSLFPSGVPRAVITVTLAVAGVAMAVAVATRPLPRFR